ncbi:uncharacterized protein PGTG_04220 [Puccinia graminis f. sp. tritici CRL 75-36-700-3]|uniref:Uncharacterized protein n=1 Tax=Puccinia graminis f. sp. tritici (strain CRL 75-36-700-3 / race SCCL) TaxID=418459 RepID=E3K1T9_PUCGT|nr:uncharacterized protein PGTG_04220 [Puccinia graminis f. sp. tritici CRL 75-36-700-3]EFP78264.1 hypothetical protein PGTG_04220 [Puccinia graminis f. sp. tritici CRL 75-36-700-3]
MEAGAGEGEGTNCVSGVTAAGGGGGDAEVVEEGRVRGGGLSTNDEMGGRRKGDGSGIGEGGPDDLQPSSESLLAGELGMGGAGSRGCRKESGREMRDRGRRGVGKAAGWGITGDGGEAVDGGEAAVGAGKMAEIPNAEPIAIVQIREKNSCVRSWVKLLLSCIRNLVPDQAAKRVKRREIDRGKTQNGIRGVKARGCIAGN